MSGGFSASNDLNGLLIFTSAPNQLTTRSEPWLLTWTWNSDNSIAFIDPTAAERAHRML